MLGNSNPSVQISSSSLLFLSEQKNPHMNWKYDHGKKITPTKKHTLSLHKRYNSSVSVFKLRRREKCLMLSLRNKITSYHRQLLRMGKEILFFIPFPYLRAIQGARHHFLTQFRLHLSCIYMLYEYLQARGWETV